MVVSVDTDTGDPWMLAPDGDSHPFAEPVSHPLRFNTFGGITPLDTQSTVFPKLTVPDALWAALFGEVQNAAEATAPFHTYAVLDAAKLPNLPELLEDSGLQFRCLFKGEAYEEMRDVAPWLVQLEDGNSFTRNLFTQSDAPWHLWDSEPGIYLRSRDPLEIVFAHLRRFFRLRDEAGAWYYLRLHEPRVMRALLRGAPVFAQRLMVPQPQGNSLTAITLLDDKAEIAYPVDVTRTEQPAIRIGPNEQAVFRHLTFETRATEVLAAFTRNGLIAASLADGSMPRLKKQAVSALHRIYAYGFQQPLQQERWILWDIFYGPNFEHFDPSLFQLCQSRSQSSGERFALFQRRLEELYP